MKSNTSQLILVITALCLIASPQAVAREKTKTKIQETSKNTVSMEDPAPNTAPKKLAVGIASSEQLTKATAFTGIMELDSKNLIQAYFAVPSSSPFQFSLAGAYKHTLAEHGSAGLHVGGGLGFGITSKSAAALIGNSLAEAFGGTGSSSATDFYVSFAGIGGIHMPFPGTSNVMIHFDAGPVLHIQSGANDFNIGALSGLLGASIVYYL